MWTWLYNTQLQNSSQHLNELNLSSANSPASYCRIEAHFKILLTKQPVTVSTKTKMKTEFIF